MSGTQPIGDLILRFKYTILVISTLMLAMISPAPLFAESDHETVNILSEKTPKATLETTELIAVGDPPKMVKTSLSSFGDFRVDWKELSLYTDEHVVMAPGDRSSSFEIDWLASRGMEFSVVIWPWDQSNSAFDTVYNSSFRQEQMNKIEQDLDFNWNHMIDAVVLGDEEPLSGCYNWFSFDTEVWPEKLAKYNATYYAETGYYFKSIWEMNGTESYYFQEWLANTTANAMNMIYDKVKTINADWQVMWSILPSPGYEPEMVKTDRYGMVGVYSIDNRDSYSMVRMYKTLDPETEVSVGLWGFPYEGANYFSPEIMKQHFWSAYAGGADYISYFNYGWQNYYDEIQKHERGKEYWQHIKEIFEEGRNFPVIQPHSSILMVTSERGVTPTWEYHTPGLTNYDVTSQRLIAKDAVDLQEYSTLILAGQFNIWEDTAERINAFVSQGGNLVVLGGGDYSMNEFWEPSATPLSIFPQLDDFQYKDPEYLDINNSTELDLRQKSTVPISRNVWKIDDKTNFKMIPTGAAEEQLGYYSLFLYQNTSNPASGKVFYNGLQPALDEDLYLSILEQVYTHELGEWEDVSKPNTRELIFGIGKDTNDNLILSSIPTTQPTVYVPVNISRWFGKESAPWTYTRDAILDSPTSLILGTVDESAADTALIGDAVLPHEIIHFTMRDNTVHPEPVLTTSKIMHTITTSEIFSLSANITVGNTFARMEDLEVGLDLPAGIELMDTIKSYTNDDYIETASVKQVTWLLQAKQAGTYSIPIYASALDTESGNRYQQTCTAQFGVKEGRLEISPDREFYNVVPDERIRFGASITLSGKEDLEGLTFDYIVLDYKFGNPGAITTIEKLEANSTTHVEYDLILQGGIPGMVGLLKMQAYHGSTDYSAQANSYVYMYESRIEANIGTSKLSRGRDQELEVNLYSLGVKSPENVRVELVLPSSLQMVDSNIHTFETLPLQSTQSMVFTLQALEAGNYVVGLKISGDNCGDEYFEFEVEISSFLGSDGLAMFSFTGVMIIIGIMVYQAKLWRKIPGK